jgi:hypothetical protein
MGVTDSPKRRFQKQRINSKRRGIPFYLTFPQWLRIWVRSGHLHESGKHCGQYCMARRGDKGAYEVGNVKIIPVEQNHREMRHTAENKEKARLRWLGRKHTEETKRKIGRGNLGKIIAPEHRAIVSEFAKTRPRNSIGQFAG